MPRDHFAKKLISAILAPAALCLMLAGCNFALPDVTDSTTSSAVATTTATESVTESSSSEEETTSSSEETTSSSSKEETTTTASETITTSSETYGVSEDGEYYSKDEVALYIHLYGHLPSNFITKKEARALGWSGGSVEDFAPGKVIGGDKYGNYEGNLPGGKGLTYHECDIDTKGKSKRGAKRIVFSNDGHIYYTDDHYSTFTLLYGD